MGRTQPTIKSLAARAQGRAPRSRDDRPIENGPRPNGDGQFPAKHAFLTSEPADPDTLVKYRGELAGNTYLFTFTITKAGKIYSVRQREE